MNFVIAGRDDIEQGIVIRNPYVVISISDPRRRRPRLHRSATFRAALHLKFHDAVPIASERLPNGIVPMNFKHARQIWKFVRRYRDQVDAIVVHCEQGMSRSPAVAAALCKALGGDPARFFNEYQPNEYIYRLLLRTVPPCLGTNK